VGTNNDELPWQQPLVQCERTPRHFRAVHKVSDVCLSNGKYFQLRYTPVRFVLPAFSPPRHSRLAQSKTLGTNSAVTSTLAQGAMAQGICHPPVTPDDRIRIPGQFTRDLWCTEWQWDRILSQYFGFPPSVSFHVYSILTDSPTTSAIQ
jgi:hypothetical protein